MKSIRGTKHAEPTKPVEPAKSSEPAKPSEPAEPAGRVKPKVWRVLAAGLVAMAVPAAPLIVRSADADGAGWRVVTSSPVLAFDAQLIAAGPRDAWAFGAYAGDSWIPPTAFHWDGRRWSTMGLPPGRPGVITAASASGPRDVWAGFVGRAARSSALLHWDGRAWSTAKAVPELGDITGLLTTGPQDLWVFGSTASGPDSGAPPVPAPGSVPAPAPGAGTGVAWHRTAGGWTRVELPAAVNHAVARSAHDVWALADDRVLHYDGRSWKNVSMKGAFPDRGGHPFLSGIATSKAGIWICADLDSPRPGVTSLLLHHDGRRWTYERTEAKAGRWYPAENTPVADGAGGFWMRGSTDVNGYDSALVHRSAAGAWTRTPITVDRRPAEVHALVRLPGTSHLLAVGSYPSALPFADETGGVLSLARATL